MLKHFIKMYWVVYIVILVLIAGYIPFLKYVAVDSPKIIKETITTESDIPIQRKIFADTIRIHSRPDSLLLLYYKQKNLADKRQEVIFELLKENYILKEQVRDFNREKLLNDSQKYFEEN